MGSHLLILRHHKTVPELVTVDVRPGNAQLGRLLVLRERPAWAGVYHMR